MKSRFCTVYLYLFGFDALLGVFRTTATLFGSKISTNPFLQLFCGIFTSAIIVLAIIQIILGFSKKFRWSARIIGIYVIFYMIVAPVVGVIFGIVLALQGVPPEALNLYLLGSPFFNSIMAIICVGQLGLFFWALKDLSKGHYLAKGKT